MNLRFQMIDCETGEILAHRYENLACNMQTPNDVGFQRIVAWAESCIRGIRIANHDMIELRIAFSEVKAPPFLQFKEPDLKCVLGKK